VIRVAVYSALYGPYEDPKPVPVDLGVPAIMFTDNPDLDAPGWQIRHVNHGVATLRGDPAVTAPMLAHKWWKLHPHLAVPDVDVSIWVDASMTILPANGFVARCLDALGDNDWVMAPHPERKCIYDEAVFSALLVHRYDPAAITAQATHYREVVGHPPGWGLFATGHLVRRHTDQVAELGGYWWDECVTWSHQDQLSLPVLLHMVGDKIRWQTSIPWHTWCWIAPHRPW
jgi:alkaline ceramidase TOD1/glycosyltransferase MUCI70-like protein